MSLSAETTVSTHLTNPANSIMRNTANAKDRNFTTIIPPYPTSRL